MKHHYWYNIIFSADRSYRWKRHFLFWLAVFSYQLLRIGIMLPISGWHSFFSLLELSIFMGIITNMSFSYTITYFLVPRYFKNRKYILFTIGLVLLYLIIVVVGSIHARLLSGQPVIKAIGYIKAASFFDRASGIRVLGNPPLICGLLLSLKTLKNWYLELLKTETLAKENASAELQLLKAQVHPHFLFNTLNNIYSFSLNQSPQAGILVNKLSGMLSYMIHECNERLVPLEKEIKLIEDYMGLEKVRYGKRLDMQIEIHGDFKNKLIVPLLLIPFVENCFKHGASIMRGQQWINLKINITDSQLDFQLSNSKPAQTINGNKKGIGLANVQKRLQLLYPEKYYLKTESANDIFNVHLQINLIEKKDAEVQNILNPKLQPPAYA